MFKLPPIIKSSSFYSITFGDINFNFKLIIERLLGWVEARDRKHFIGVIRCWAKIGRIEKIV
jgi:hypothetical protein